MRLMNFVIMSKPISFYQNQLHKHPKLKYDENQKVRLYLKSGDSTMLLVKGLTSLAATSLSMNIESFIKQHNCVMAGKFIQTR